MNVEILPVILITLYFIMGFGVFNMWKRIVDDDWSLFIIIMWPVVVVIAAIIKPVSD
jgi:hypothetical protein